MLVRNWAFPWHLLKARGCPPPPALWPTPGTQRSGSVTQGGNRKTNHSSAGGALQPGGVHSQQAGLARAKRTSLLFSFLAFKERFTQEGEEGKFPTFQPCAGFRQGLLRQRRGEAWLKHRGKKLWSTFYGLIHPGQQWLGLPALSWVRNVKAEE